MEVFLDKEVATAGQRTMIHLELTEPVGRDVSAFSLYPQECEVLLPPNVCFEVVSHYIAGSGLVIVQCKQTESLDALLDLGRPGDVPLGKPIEEVPMGLPADADEELQAKMARLQVAREKTVKEAQRERDVSRLIELGADTRERAIELLEIYGSLQAAANALCAAADTSIPSEVLKWVEQLRSGGERQKEEAAAALANLAHNADNQVAIARAGGVEPLVALARGGGSNATAALGVLACNADNRVAIARAGGIAPLVALARGGTDGQKEWAAGALRNLAVNADNQVAIAKAGGIKPLVVLARNGTDGQKRCAAEALKNLARNAKNKVTIADVGWR